jgi:hypothetical protein
VVNNLVVNGVCPAVPVVVRGIVVTQVTAA